MGLLVHQIPVGGFDKNLSYIIYDDATEAGVIVDPAGDVNLIYAAVQDLHVTITAVYLTHTHFDHFDGLPEVITHSGTLPIYVHEQGKGALTEFSNVKTIIDGERLNLGSHTITVMHTPGHIDDAVCYFIAAADATSGKPKLLSGDTLFINGCGRTNEARVADLYHSLQKLRTLPVETIIYPGHHYGPTLTAPLAEQLQSNKYLQAADFATFKKLRLG